MDPSLKPDPNRKGSYYRRIEDVARALDNLESRKASAAIRFLGFYFGCEKVARGLIGIHNQWPAPKAYRPGQSLKLNSIKTAAAAIGLQVPQQDFDWIFADFNEQHLLQTTADWTNSARYLRNNLTHEFGPTNATLVAKHAPFHNPKMEAILDSVPDILKYLRLHFANVT